MVVLYPNISSFWKYILPNLVINLFRRLNKELGLTISMVTHEPEDKNVVDRVINLKDGLITKILEAPTVLNCEHCSCKIYEEGAITRAIEGKTHVFCSENCADSFEAGRVSHQNRGNIRR